MKPSKKYKFDYAKLQAAERVARAGMRGHKDLSEALHVSRWNRWNTLGSRFNMEVY